MELGIDRWIDGWMDGEMGGEMAPFGPTCINLIIFFPYYFTQTGLV